MMPACCWYASAEMSPVCWAMEIRSSACRHGAGPQARCLLLMAVCCAQIGPDGLAGAGDALQSEQAQEHSCSLQAPSDLYTDANTRAP